MRGKALDYILRVIKDTMETKKGKIVTTVKKKKFRKKVKKISDKQLKEADDFVGGHSGAQRGQGAELEDFDRMLYDPALENTPRMLTRRRQLMKDDPDYFRN